MRTDAGGCDRPSDRAQRPRQVAAVGQREHVNRRDQRFLHGNRSLAQQTQALRGHREPLTPPVLRGWHFCDQPQSYEALDDDRDGALMLVS